MERIGEKGDTDEEAKNGKEVGKLNTIREVSVRSLSYFGATLKVKESKEVEADEEWPEEKMMAEKARMMDMVDRQEKVARSLRAVWASEFLMEDLWKREKRRKDLRRWSKI